jgi:hypothetical protein
MGRVCNILEEMRNFHNLLREQGLTIDTSMPILIGDSMYRLGRGVDMCKVPRNFLEL